MFELPIPWHAGIQTRGENQSLRQTDECRQIMNTDMKHEFYCVKTSFSGYTIFSMLNSAELEISITLKCQNRQIC